MGQQEDQSPLFLEIAGEIQKQKQKKAAEAKKDVFIVNHDEVGRDAGYALAQTYDAFVAKKINSKQELENFNAMVKKFCLTLAKKKSFKTRKKYEYEEDENGYSATKAKAVARGKKMAADLHEKPKPATEGEQSFSISWESQNQPANKKSYRPKKAARRPGAAK